MHFISLKTFLTNPNMNSMHKRARESNTNVCSFIIVINVVAVRNVCVAKDEQIEGSRWNSAGQLDLSDSASYSLFIFHRT